MTEVAYFQQQQQQQQKEEEEELICKHFSGAIFIADWRQAFPQALLREIGTSFSFYLCFLFCGSVKSNCRMVE